MVRRTATVVRPFGCTLADAEGLLTVERATFDESPYSAEQVQAMLNDGPQRAWLALGEGHVVGFVIAFPTNSLRGSCWEIDLLAVHPDWTGRGLATRLIRAAAAEGVDVARWARAVVAVDNRASARAFTRAGFWAKPGTHKLWICRPQGLSLREWPTSDVSVREASEVPAAIDYLADLPLQTSKLHEHAGPALLVAEREGKLTGHAELIEVQTLLYHGVWIESLETSTRAVQKALIHQAVHRAKVAGMDEIGVMVPESNQAFQDDLLYAGFQSLGAFRWLIARLPLPGLASRAASFSHTADKPGDGIV